MKNKAAGILIAYVIGQATQLIIHGMCLSFNMYNYRQIPFCAAAGFIIIMAVVAGIQIQKYPTDEPRHEQKKTYLDWAKIPGPKQKGLANEHTEDVT